MPNHLRVVLFGHFIFISMLMADYPRVVVSFPLHVDCRTPASGGFCPFHLGISFRYSQQCTAAGALGCIWFFRRIFHWDAPLCGTRYALVDTTSCQWATDDFGCSTFLSGGDRPRVVVSIVCLQENFLLWLQHLVQWYLRCSQPVLFPFDLLCGTR